MNPSEANSYPRRFGPLVLVQFLEEGGMGRVYLALRGTRSNPSPCVVKFMGSAYTDPLIKLEERFHQEVQIAKSLSHPHIASTFQSGISDQGPYLVQEFVHGLSLRALASSVADDTGHFEIPLAAYIVSCVAEALEYVHEFGGQGLVHRDVTPENVMLSFQGDVKLIDFGVAKSTTNDPNLTVAGGWVGKPYWTAPELFRGGRLDRRADLYALGLLLWYLLSGKDPAHTMEHLVGDKEHYPPASRFHPGLPPELDDIVRKSLSLDPAERYPTADSLRQALAGYIPDGYPGKAALRAFLGRYSSPTSEASLKSLLDSGIPLLGHTATQVTQKLYFNRAARPKTRGRWTKAFLLLMMGGAAVSAVYSTFRPLPPIPSPPPEAPAVPPPATPPPASPPPTPPGPVLVPDAASAPIVDPPPPDVAPARPEPPARRAHRKAKSPDLPTGGGQGAESAESAESANSILAEAQDSFERSELPQALSLARYAAKEGAGAKAYILIGIILAMQRDIPGARAALEKALELSPGNAEALKHLERLRR